MVATQPVNRIGAHFDSPPTPKHVIPKSETERGLLWSDILFEAALTLRDQLRSRNEAVAASAAHALLDLERTRMRHGKPLAGSNNLSEAQREFEEDQRVGPEVEIDEDDDEDDEQPGPAVPAARVPAPPEIRVQPPLPPPISREPNPAFYQFACPVFGSHAEEAYWMLRNPKNYFAPKDGKEVTMCDAVELVKAQCEAWDYKPWEIPAGHFRETIRARLAEVRVQMDSE